MKVKSIPLQSEEYYHDQAKKTVIALHHTAGSHRPDFSINGWETDKDKAGKVLHVGTAYLIGGLSTTDKNADWDGVIVQAFPDECWAHHYGTLQPNNVALNQMSVAIEVCNYGPLKLGKDGNFYNYVNKPVPREMVVKLEQPFRGFEYYHAYTPAQIAALKELIIFLSEKYNIAPNMGLQQAIKDKGAAVAFEINHIARTGSPGVWSHSNFIAGKFDMTPQPALIEMLLSL